MKTKMKTMKMMMIGRTKKIPLTQGQFAVVDSKDFEYLNQWKWHALWSPGTKSFYAVRSGKRDSITHKQQLIRMHRVIMKLKHGDGSQVDHENHNTLDNRRSNLEIATHRSNAENRRDQSVHGVGIKKHIGGKYEPQVALNGKRRWLGLYATPEEAQAVRKQFFKEKGLTSEE